MITPNFPENPKEGDQWEDVENRVCWIYLNRGWHDFWAFMKLYHAYNSSSTTKTGENEDAV